MPTKEMRIRFVRKNRQQPIGAKLSHRSGKVYVAEVTPNSLADNFLVANDEIIRLVGQDGWDPLGHGPKPELQDIFVTIRRPPNPYQRLLEISGFRHWAEDIKELKTVELDVKPPEGTDLGLYVIRRDGRVYVVAADVGSEAAAKFLPQDVILTVNGTPVTGATHCRSLVTAAKGKFRCEVEREVLASLKPPLPADKPAEEEVEQKLPIPTEPEELVSHFTP